MKDLVEQSKRCL